MTGQGRVGIGTAALLMWAFAGAAWALPTPQEMKKAGRFFQKGERALQAGDVAQASGLFRQAIEIVPALPEAHIGLGHIALLENRFEEALSEYRRAKQGYEEVGEALVDLQTRRYNNAQRQIEAARDQINLLQAPSGGSGGPGSATQDVGLRVSKLENQIQQLEAIQPPDPDALGAPPAEIDFYIGNALFRLQRIGEAIEAWERCAEKNPSYAMVYNNLALGYWQAGRLDQARASLSRAEELGFPVNPQFKQDLMNAGTD